MFDGALLIASVLDVETALQKAYGSVGLAASAVLFHSGGKGASEEQTVALWDSELEVTQQTRMVLDLSMIAHTIHRLEIEADDVLDMRIYADRLYLATDGGLYSTDLDPATAVPTGRAVRRIEAPTYGASVRYGTVAASCGESGLQVLFDDFGWRNGNEGGSPRQISEYSVRAEYASGRILNYQARSDIELFRGTIEDPTVKGSRATGIMVGAVLAEQEANEFLAGFDSPDIELVWTGGSRIVALVGGKAIARTFRKHRDKLAVQGRVRTLGAYEGRPLSAVAIRQRLVVETTDEVLALTASDDGDSVPGQATFGFERIDTGPVVSLRAFPDSVRYRDLAIATTAQGLNVLGLVR